MKNKSFDYESVVFGKDKFVPSLFEVDTNFLKFYVKNLKGLPKERKHKLLDIGCGGGSITKALKRKFPNINFSACDISHTAIEIAKKDNLGIRFFECNVEEMKGVKNETYDIVITNSVLDHLEGSDKGVNEIYRILKKGGIFLSATPIEADTTTIHGHLNKFKAFRKHRREYLGHIHTFTKKRLFSLIKSPGFKITEVNYDWFYLSQLIDIAYYPLLKLIGKGPSFSLQSYAKNSNSISAKAVKYLRNTVSFFERLESIITYKIPLGFFAYIRAVKH